MAAANSLGDGSYSSRRWDIEDIREMTSAVQAGALDEGGRLLVYHAGSGMVPELKEITRDSKVGNGHLFGFRPLALRLVDTP